ncbi:MAG: histidine--tRNA ligase [Bacilli bacterium]|nr:histidine--tRNA ligase [Bacilli bacterium]
MNFELKNIKGTFDYLPDEQVIRNKITDTLKEIFELYGYLPIETPILCSYDLLASKYAGGSEILKEVYTLKDQGDRDLGLRYDLTVPFSKVLGMMKEPILPFKRYEIGKVFRDGPVKLGRSREFYQCDVDVCGIESVTAEAELFAMAVSAYKKLGIDIEIYYNNRKLLSGIMEFCGIEKTKEAILIIDKLEKISKQEIYFELGKLEIDSSIVDKLYTYFSFSLEELKSQDINNALFIKGIEEIEELNKYLTGMNIETNCVFKPFLARGLEIYTGTVWEVFDKKRRINSSLGGGGRYDDIITKFIGNGNDYPAVGMSFGLEPIYAVLKEENDFKEKLYDLYIFAFDLNPKVLQVAQKLRESKIKVIVEMNTAKLKKGMNFANRNNIPFVLLIGEEEIKNNKYSFKNMETGMQELLSLEDIIERFKK